MRVHFFMAHRVCQAMYLVPVRFHDGGVFSTLVGTGRAPNMLQS